MKLKNLFLIISTVFFCGSGFAQKTVTGKVTDADSGEGLIGATIIIPNTSLGTVTDLDGNYTLEVPKGTKRLRFSYTGYETTALPIGKNKTLDVQMAVGKTLDEVIVIGYGTVNKSDKTGAIESIKPIDEEVQQYDDFESFLQGRAKGVYVQSSGRELGAPNSIRIRGANSLRGDNEPLYVVDGIIVNSATEDAADPLQGGSSYLSPQGGLTGINQQDIESIEILKDASATAIYGSRGANGVILITTKKGKKRKGKKGAEFSYRATTRVGQATNLVDVLSTDEYIDYQDEFRELQGFDPIFYRYGDGSIAPFLGDSTFMEVKSDSIPRFTPVNWYDDILQNSYSQNHRLSVSNGGDKSNYYIAAGYTHGTGNIPNVRRRQGDFLINFSQKLNDRLTISPRISTAYIDNNASKGTENLGSANSSFVRQMILAAPVLGYFENNELVDIDEGLDGPRAWIRDYDDDSQEFRTLAALKADYKINDIFTYRFLAGADYRNKQRQVWYGNSIRRGFLANGEAGISQLNRIRYNVDNTLLFKTKINKNNRINGTVGFVFDETNIEQKTFTASDFANKDLRYDGISFGQVFTPLQYDWAKETILSALGRVNYTLNNRYIFTASFRRDGSSKFSKGNKYSFFPSAAFAWKLMEEPFLKNNTLFSDAKVRIGYGRTGSQAIRPYQTFSRFSATSNLLSTGQGGGVTAILPQNLGNPNLIWETTDQFNAGLDFGFKNDRFVGSVDVYQKITRDLLQQFSIGPSAGFETIISNQGSLKNRGIELGLTAHILEGKLKWTVSGNISFNRNEITNLGLTPTQFGTETYSAYLGSFVSGGTAFKAPANIFIEGQPAGLFWGYQTDGIIQTAEDLDVAPDFQGVPSRLGDLKYVDQNNDGIVNDLDLTIIGDPNPDFNYGIGSEFSYGNFSLNLFFNGVYGNDIANGNRSREDIALGSADNVRTAAYLGAWREGRTDATHPRLGYPLLGDFNDRLVEDGSFLRLTFVSLGYKLPKRTIKGIDNASVFVTGHNLLLITNYTGFDPEVNSFFSDPSRIGVDWNSFPNQKSVSAGLNITF